MQGSDVNTYLGPVTATLPVRQRFVYRTHGQWWAFAESRLREGRSGNTLRVWLGTVQARDADEVYVCQHTHRSDIAADRCALREAKRRVAEDRRRAHEELRREKAEWSARLGLEQPIAVEPLSVTRALEEARRLGYLVTPGLAWTSWLPSAWWTDCEQRHAPCVVVNLQGRYASVECNLEKTDVDEVSERHQVSLHWLTRSFTEPDGELWWGISSGSDRCRRDRAAELAVRLGALARDVIASAYAVG